MTFWHNLSIYVQIVNFECQIKSLKKFLSSDFFFYFQKLELAVQIAQKIFEFFILVEITLYKLFTKFRSEKSWYGIPRTFQYVCNHWQTNWNDN